MKLEINHREVSLHRLDEFEPASPFEGTTVQFIRDWMEGKPSYQIQTSGSTGKPKIINITRGQMEASARLTIQALNLQPDQIALACLDTAYIAGKMMLVRALVNSMSIVAITPSSNPLKGLLIQPDFAALVPLQLEAILANDRTRSVLNKMQVVIVGGAPVSVQLEEAVRDLKVPVYLTYGMTETISHVALKKLNGKDKAPFFTAFEEVKLGVDARECLTIHSILTHNKTLITNDKVILFNEHNFEWLGRADNVINTGGVKVQSEKVERAVERIMSDLGIMRKFFITGRPDRRLGQKVCLVIESSHPIQEENDILMELRKVVSRYEMPATISYVSPFSLTPTGKVNRQATLAVS